jgi:hypothetical protein
MFIELTEALRCPRQHAESYVICAPVTMDGRDVVRGGILCPVCREEFAILDRVAWFGPPAESPDVSEPKGPLTADAAVTFLDLQGEGGYLLLVGAAGRLAAAFARALPRIGIVCVNPPAGTGPGPGVSVVRSPTALPLRSRSVRAAVVGADAAQTPWLDASVQAVLPGLRVIVEDEAAAPAGIEMMARGAGILVGEKRAG